MFYLVMHSSLNFTSRAEPSWKFSEPSQAELDILEERAESELDFLKMIFNFFPRILFYFLEFFKREGNLWTYIRAK